MAGNYLTALVPEGDTPDVAHSQNSFSDTAKGVPAVGEVFLEEGIVPMSINGSGARELGSEQTTPENLRAIGECARGTVIIGRAIEDIRSSRKAA